MRISAISIISICALSTLLLYFLYYFLIPIIASGMYLNKKYAKSKYEDGIFWVKLNKEDPDYWVYKIDTTGVKIKDVCWVIYFKHKEAYDLYLKGREADGNK